MDAVDVAPSRLERAREAAAALLRDATGARLGVVVFGADAFTVAPLTSDAGTLVHLFSGVGTATLPRAGSRPDLGVDMARALLKQSGAERGDVILVGDSSGDARALEAARALADSGFSLSVLAVGTAQGAPVPLAGGGAFARTDAGEIVVARTDFPALERLAQAGRGRFQVLPADGEIPRLDTGVSHRRELQVSTPSAPSERHEGGAWLALAALPLAALLFRRGWLLCVAAATLTMALPPAPAHAFDWPDLWRRADQQAAAAFARGKPSESARMLEKIDASSPWRAPLLYRSGNFADAAAEFAARDTADAHYNRGNALALDGDLEGALAAYDAALSRNPSMEDALFNRAVVRKALASRSMQPPDDETRGKSRPRNGAAAASRPQGPAGRSEDGDGRRRSSAADELKTPAQRPAAEEGARPQDPPEERRPSSDRLSADELERLENLLARASDSQRSLLANRFAHQLRSRGTPDRDTGARW
jgi:Ca-activated chloride channel family protein